MNNSFVCLGALVLLVVIPPAIFFLDRLGFWMERRGWILWRSSRERGPGGGGAMSGFLTEFQRIVEPQTKHVAEDRAARRLEDDDDFGQNDPPKPRT